MAQRFPRERQKGPVVIPNCIQVRVIWTTGTRTMINVLHGNLTQAGPINPGDADTLFTAFKSALTSSNWTRDISTNVSLSQVSIKDLRAANNPQYFNNPTNLPQAGTGTGIEIGLQTAIVVTLRTAQSGRGFRGRVYLGGLVDAALASPTTSTSQAEGDAVAFITALGSAMTARGYGLVVAQQLLLASTVPGAPPPLNTNRNANVVPVTQINIASSRLDTQRRRLGRH